MTVTKLRMTALAPTTKRGFVVGILASLKECRTNIIGAISLGRNQFPEGRKPDSSRRVLEVRIQSPPAESLRTIGSSERRRIGICRRADPIIWQNELAGRRVEVGARRCRSLSEAGRFGIGIRIEGGPRKAWLPGQAPALLTSCQQASRVTASGRSGTPPGCRGVLSGATG